MVLLTGSPESLTDRTALAWRDLLPGAAALPDWLPRVALADVVTSELLTVVEESLGSTCLPGGGAALLGRLEAAGAFPGGDAVVGHTLRPDVRAAMLAALVAEDPDLVRTRRELLRAGLAHRYPVLALPLALWAAELRDWASLDLLWGTYSPGVFLAAPPVRAAYCTAPDERRAALPALSYGKGMSEAFDPVTGQIDLDVLIATLVRDGRMLHSRWEQKQSADARVAAGTLWMLAQAALPGVAGDQGLDAAAQTCERLVRVAREASGAGSSVTSKTLTFFHAVASLVAFLRADWARARREAEFAMMLTDSCSFAGFLGALVTAMSSTASGNTQYFAVAERYLSQHAQHQCRVATWIDSALHLPWADAAIRRLDRQHAERHLRMHDIEGAAITRWFGLQPMQARLSAKFGMIWQDPEPALARFDAVLAAAAPGTVEGAWEPMLRRSRAELLMSIGELHHAEQVVAELLEQAGASASAVPAARLQLLWGNLDNALARADESIFSLELPLADRAHLYAIKSAALCAAEAPPEQVAAAAAAACVVGQQAGTLVPLAMLPSELRSRLLADHRRHHSVDDCLFTAAARDGLFDALPQRRTAAPGTIRLTRRERELLPLLATGASVKDIAAQLFISVNTVRKQVVGLRAKFDAGSRAELVRRARIAGLLGPSTGS